ncbi:glycosyltransferase [Francisella philomiragia]|uniref:glycosyltransferase n=1 Tax=Francisella philomiragia TaxID=28110 RepID=UPI001906D1E6|nr:glycosyltransferase [Francisella philomiragia]MBK2092372.1 glycosyltransferase [Francisella philomiragia]MBK2257407.1 glycosyltransferase [Francisella philomiragia]MBK2270093.1 glycosyltransferase [Francisella philomiragia]MBK2272002.1 glycosyltransferase [Francisella philomiragia]MBK2275783.1 glycosyltransferase [Francisella philomiragia]
MLLGQVNEKIIEFFKVNNLSITFNSVFSGGAYTFLLNKSHKTPILLIDTSKTVANNMVQGFLIHQGVSKAISSFNLAMFIEKYKVSAFEINHLIWSSDIKQWMEYIINIIDKHEIKVTIYIHDFFTVCPTINLLNHENRYCGIPSSSECDKCISAYPQNVENRAIVDLVGYMEYIHNDQIKLWRDFWSELFDRSNKIIFPSASAMNLWKKAYSYDSDKLSIMHHDLEYISKIKKHSLKEQGRTSFYNVYIVGDVVPQKGSHIVAELLEILESKRLPICLNVLGGYHNDKYSQTPYLKLHGRYEHDKISDILNNSHIDCFLMLSICPETFSYTTQEMMATGLPIISFNIGAQAEFVSSYQNGVVIQYGFDATSVFAEIEKLYIAKRHELVKNLSKNDDLIEKLIVQYDNIMVENKLLLLDKLEENTEPKKSNLRNWLGLLKFSK